MIQFTHYERPNRRVTETQIDRSTSPGIEEKAAAALDKFGRLFLDAGRGRAVDLGFGHAAIGPLVVCELDHLLCLLMRRLSFSISWSRMFWRSTVVARMRIL